MPGHVVRLIFAVNPQQVLTGLLGERHSSDIFRRHSEAAASTAATLAARGRLSHHQFVGSPGFLVEEIGGAEAERTVEFAVAGVVLLVPLGVDADFVKKALHDLVVAPDVFDVERAAIDRHQPAVVAEFVALRVAAEVVVVVENQDAGRTSGILQEEVSGAEPAQAPADHHQIVRFVGVRDTRQVDGTAIAQFVGRFEGPGVIAAHSGLRGRIVIRRLFGCEFLRLPPFWKQQRSGRGRADAVDEIAPRDLAVHSETAIVRVHACLQSEPKLYTYSRSC